MLLSLCVVWLGMFMTVHKKYRRWNGWVVALLAVGASLGLLNSVLQLSRYGSDLASRFSSADWTMIVVWCVLLVVWALVLGGISGVVLGRRWYGATEGLTDGAAQGSMASSD